jgi:hypothetical protein
MLRTPESLLKKKMQKKFAKEKVVLGYNEEELDYLSKPLGKATHKHNLEEKPTERPLRKNNRKIPRWKEKVECKICGGVYMRSSSTAHKRTKRHKLFENVNSKLLNLMTKGFDENKNVE